ncbi:MAG TPA: choice-of-anchor tandem repeat GloVer-containing protein [Pirellulales bacterium]|nr:choice-of-anchor tandem repeat GloVer-containing protein [Pirellulales bacterium]
MEPLENRRLLSTTPFSTVASSLNTELAGLQTQLTSLLDAYQTGTNSSLPFLGNTLGDAAQVVSRFGPQLHDALNALGNTDYATPADLDAAVQNALGPALGSAGLKILADQTGNLSSSSSTDLTDVVIDPGTFGSGGFEVTMWLHVAQTLVNSSGNFNTGLPGLPLQVSANGGIQVTAGFDFELAFGYNATTSTTFLDSASPTGTLPAGPGKGHEMAVTVDASLPAGFNATATLGFVQGSLTPIAAMPTSLVAGIVADHLDATPTVALTLQADANLQLTGGFSGVSSTDFPSIGAEFHLHWSFDSSNPAAGEPQVSFDNVGLNLGSFLRNMLAPVLTTIQDVTGPLQPVFDVLNAPLPVLSDLSHLVGGNDVTLLGLAKLVAPSLGPGFGPLADLIGDLDKFITDVNGVTVSSGNIAIPLGGFNLDNYDLRTAVSAGDVNNASLTNLTSLDPGNIQPGQAFADFVSGLNVPQSVKDGLNQLTSGLTTSGLNNGIDLEFPILNNPGQAVFNMLLGKDSDLFSLTATEQLHAQENVADFSVAGMGVTFGGEVKVDAKFTFAYDTYGLREMINQAAAGTLTGSDVASDITDGFYVADDSHLDISGNIGASAGVSLGFFSVSVGGGVSTGNGGQDPVSVTINDPDNDGKLRFSEVPSNPLAAFKTSGELDAGLGIDVKIGVTVWPAGFIGYEKHFDIAHTVIFSFNPQTPPPIILAEADSNGNVNLDIGSRAGRRQGVDQTDGNENYTIRHLGDDSDGIGGETIEIDAFKTSQIIHHVKNIIGVGDAGDLTINVMQGVESSVSLNGGQGHANLTYSGTGQANLSAGQLDSVLTGGAGYNNLVGGPGNDTITTGPGSNLISDVQGNNTFIIAGAFASITLDDGTPGNNTLEIVAQKTTTSVSVTPSNGALHVQINDSSAPDSSALIAGISQLIVNGHDRSASITVGDLSGAGISQETIDVAGGAGSRAIDLETRASGDLASLALSALTQTYPDAKNPSITNTEHGVAIANSSTGLTASVFGMSADDTLTIREHGGSASIADLGTAAGTIILDTTGRQDGFGEVVTMTTPAQGNGSTITTDGYGASGSAGFRIRAAGDPDVVMADLQTSDSITIDVSAPLPGNTNQVSLDASALVGALHVAALGLSFDFNHIQLSKVGAQATVSIDGGSTTSTVTVGTGQLAPIEGNVTVANAILTIDNSAAASRSNLVMTGTTFSGWGYPANMSTLTYSRLEQGLVVNLGPGDQLGLEQTPPGINGATFNDLSSTLDYVYLVGASAPLTFNGDFALDLGERLSADGSVTQVNDLQGLANLLVTLNLSHADSNSSSVAFWGAAGQSYTIGGNGNFVVNDTTVGLSVMIYGFRIQDWLLFNLPGGSVNADLTQTSLSPIYVEGSTRAAGATAANNITVTTNAAGVTMQPDATVPSTFRITSSNEPVFLVAGMMSSDSLTVDLLAPSPNQVYIDASLLAGALNVNALGDNSNQNNITLAKAGPQAAVTIDGGNANTKVTFATGQLALIEHNATVRNAKLVIDNSAASIASILTLTDSMVSGWEIPGTSLAPVLQVDALTSLTIDAAAGDRFDLEEALPVTINNASTTRDAVYDMRTGGVLNGDFALFMGWRLLHDGTITKPETLQGLHASMLVNFSSASDAATQVVLDGNQDPAGAAYTIGNNKIGNLLFANQTVGLSVEINGYRSRDQVTIDLPGGSVAADLRHTGPATIYLDGTVRLSGMNPTAANQFTVQARSGAATMQPDGPNESVFSIFNTLYLLGSMPQDSLNLTQPTNFKVAPTAAKPAAASYGFELDDVAWFGAFVAGYATAYLQQDPPSGWVYNLHSPAPVLIPNAQLPDQDRLSYFYNIEDSPATILDAQPLDYLGDNVDYNDSSLTYAGGGYVLRHDDNVAPNTGYYTVGPLPYGQLTVYERIFTVTSHPVPIDNTVNLDASQLRGAFHYTAADPNYALLQELLLSFGGSVAPAIAFGKTTVNLSGVNPQSAVTVSGQHELGFDYYQDAFLLIGGQESFPGASFSSSEIADNRIPTTSVSVGAGLMANIQGNVAVQQVQLTVDDGRGTLPGIMTLTDTSLTGWTTALGATRPTLSFDASLHDDFVIIGSPVDQFDVENTPATLAAVQQSGFYGLLPTPVGLNQTLIQNLATSGTPASVYVMGKALPRLNVTGNFALTIGRRLNPDGTVDDVGTIGQVFYQGNHYQPDYSQPITFQYTGIGLGPLVVDRSSESVYSGPSGIYANTDDAGHYYLKSDLADRSGLLNGDIVFAGPNTEFFYDAEYDPQRTEASFEIENTLSGAVHYIANPKASAATVSIGAAYGPIDVQGSGANTRVTLDPTLYVNNGVAGSSLRDTVTADVSVTNATLRIVADSAAVSTPQNPPDVVLTDSQLTGVAGGTVHFQNLADGVKVDPNFSGLIKDYGLSLQLPRDDAISTLIQNTPSSATTEITTADAAVASGAVAVTGTTGTLWLGRDYPDSGFARSAFSVASVMIGGGSLDGISGSIALEYTSAVPTTIDDHANSMPTQGTLSLGPASTDANNNFVGYYPLEFDTPHPIYLGYAFNNRTLPLPLDIRGAAQSHFTVTYSPVGTRLFAGAGGTVDVTQDAFSTAPSLAIFGAAAVHVLFSYYPDGAPITVEADPARPLDSTDLTVAYNDSNPPTAINLAAAGNGFEALTGTYSPYDAPGQIDYEAATTHLAVSGGISSSFTVTDTGAGGTTIGPGYTQLYVQGTDGPLTLSDGPATHLALGNAGSVQALHGEIDILANNSAQPPLPVVVDDSADGTGRTIGVSLDESGNTLVSGLAPALIKVFDTRATIAIAGGSGGNLLVGPDIADSWQITGADSGTVDGNVSFAGVGSLQGGMAADTFAFQRSGSLSGHLDGGPGFDTLDYSAAGLTGSEPFDLAHDVAPRVAGPVTNIEYATLILFQIDDQTSLAGTTIVPLAIHTLGATVGENLLTFAASGLPDGLNIDAHSGSISGTITDRAVADTPYQVTITATDGTSTALTTFRWTVAPDFSLVNPGNQTNNNGDAVTLPIQSANVHDKPLQFSATGLPTGLTIDKVTGVISGTIAVSQSSVDAVTVALTNGVTTLTAPFSWTVSAQRVITVATFDQAGHSINQVHAGQPFNLQFDARFGSALDTTYNGYLYLYGYGYIYVYAGVGQIDGYTFNSPGSQTQTFYDFLDAQYGSFTINVGPPSPLTGIGVDIQATTNIPFTGIVASFTDTNQAAAASDFTASIDWGDGATSAGTVTANSTGGFDVSGTQTYALAGSYPIDVTVSDSPGDVLASTAGNAAVLSPVTMTAPADGTLTNNNEPTLSAITSGGAYSVQFQYTSDGGITWNDVGVAETAAPFSFSFTSPLPDGAYEAQAIATDGAGDSFTAVPVSFTIDTVAPIVSITSPAAGSVGNNGQPTISGVAGAASGDTNRINVYIYSGADTTGTLEETLPTRANGGFYSVQAGASESGALPDGVYTAQASQADGAGNLGQSNLVTFLIDTKAPTVSITVAVNGNQPTLSAIAADNSGGSGLASVQFQYSADGGVSWVDAGPAETAAPFNYTFSTALSVGSYLARATATDNAGNSATTAASFASIVSFSGANSYAGLVTDGKGNLYGTTYNGGANGEGTVFELNPSTGALTTLYTFSGADGAYPYSGLIMDGGGHLYGTTLGDGTHNQGTVFKLDPGTGLLTTLATFNGANGATPYASLIMDGSGNLYGTTYYGGGANGEGTVFELNPSTSALTTLYTFGGADGAYPYAGLVMDGGGNLYGTTTSGGGDTDGTVFKLNPSKGLLTTLATFNGANGATPYAGLIMDGSGNLYGATYYGGDANSEGTVFELTQTNGATVLTTLAMFNGANGAYPYAGLTMDGSGNLYGTASQGGDNGHGTVFELNPTAGVLNTLVEFHGADGASPYAPLTFDSRSGLFYGTTSGSDNGNGTVFELTPATFTIKAAAPTVVSIGPVSPSPRNVDLAADDVTFSEPIDLTNFDFSAVTLSLNGGTNLINSGATISLVSGTTATYRIAGLDTLTTADGTYILSVDASHVRDLGGNLGIGGASVSWLMDATPPTGSSVAPLPQRASSLTFNVTVNPGADPVSGGVASGIVSYDIYAASAPTGSSSLGAFSLWTTVPAGKLTATFTAQSNTTYAFHSVARDAAGNIEAKGTNVIEASTYVPDLTPPITQINADAANAVGTFTLAYSGTSPGGSGIETFLLAVQVDGGPIQQIATLPGGTPVAGVYSGQTEYQGLTDGQKHTYTFSIQGISGNGIAETSHSAPPVTQTFAVPAAPQATIFVVEKGLSERSYIRYLDVTFNEPVSSLTLDAAHVRLAHYGLDGATLINDVDLTDRIALIDHVMEIDFGAGGIGGNENLPALLADWTKLILDDGYYKLTIDPDGTGKHDIEEDFYRLFGDVTGNATGGVATTGSSSGGDLIGQVSKADVAAVTAAVGQVATAANPLLNADINGAGAVTPNDRLLAAKSVGRHLASGLHLDD